jgi:hypothetical protein
MKKFILIPVLVLLVGCQGLDIQPRNGLSEVVAFSNFEGYQSYIAKLYASLTLTGQFGAAGSPDLSIINDEGFSSYLRVWWKAQELTTDEAVIAWNDSGIRDLHNHAWGSSNQFVRVLYYRIYYTIALCNDFLRVSSELPAGLTAQETEEIGNFRNEARFIRALAHSHALDLYRNVPIITSITSDLPVQSTPQQVFDFLSDELNELEDLILAPNAADYGRVNKAAVWMLQARLNLNSQVYTGVDRSADALIATQKVIGEGYSIATNYKELFRGDNHLRTDEIIWSIVHDGLVSQTWGGTTTLVRGAIGEAMQDNLTSAGQPITDEALTNYGVPGGWGGYRTTSSLVEKFPGAVANDGVTPDRRGIFFTEGQTLDIADVGTFADGWAVPKWTNLVAGGGRSPGVDQVGTDFPVFRLADAYLMQAEAEIRASGTITGTTLGYLNELRFRAYGDNSANLILGDVTLDFILDERAREMYLEGTRRTDLIRFGKFTGGDYLWPWKGGIEAGVSTDDYLNIFPIPSSELIANPRMKQNDGY